jgi:hypothetical protein
MGREMVETEGCTIAAHAKVFMHVLGRQQHNSGEEKGSSLLPKCSYNFVKASLHRLG